MRKKLILAITAAMLLFLMIPGVVAAECCQYEPNTCCWRICCAEITYTYQVSYFQKVDSGFRTNWGSVMYTGVWTQVVVEARNSKEAAESLGLRAGYNCFVARVLGA